MRPITDTDKKLIYDYLADSYMHLLEAGKLGSFERKAISARILAQMEAAKTFADVQKLVDGLAANYSFFQTSAQQIKAKLNSFQEEKVIKNLEQYFTNLTAKKKS